MYRVKENINFLGLDTNPFNNEICESYEIIKTEDFVQPRVPLERFQYNCYNKKAIISGDIIEIVTYDKYVYEGFEVPDKYKLKCKGKQRSDNVRREDKLNEAKMRLRRLINSNVSNCSKFLTLTYRDNITDVKQCKLDLKKFFMKWNYLRSKRGQNKIKYVYVTEFQKRGAVHFHILTFDDNFKYDLVELEKLWGFGFIKANKINNVDNVGAYVVKYMSKDTYDIRLNNCDMYGRSRNLKESIEIKETAGVDILQSIYEKNKVYSKSYTTDYRGNMTYSQYNVKRYQKNDK